MNLKTYLLLLAIFVASGACKPYTRQIIIQDEERGYALHLPSDYDPQKKYPLVLNFHAFLMTANNQKLYTKMDEVADREEFIVVYPHGEKRQWDVGLPNSAFLDEQDLAFVSTLLDTLENKYNIDQERIYAAGLSMGGFFSYKLACEMGERFAAIASVSGLMTDSIAFNCTSKPSMPVLHIHGTWDPIIRYNGSKNFLSVAETIDFWRSHNRCLSEADTVDIANDYSFDLSSVQFLRYSDCQNNAEVWLYTVKHGGHSWPGWIKDPWLFGPTNRDINGSEVIWSFFKQHSLADKQIPGGQAELK